MRKSLILFIFFLVQIVTSYAQAVIINDNNHLVKENELYLITVDFLWKIKNAHYIGGHINIADTLVYIKILAPKEKRDKKSNEKIKIGNSYEMTLFRYYPYELCHEIDRYHNYNLLFGDKVVCLQATDCLNYIFTTDNLQGLYYFVLDTSSTNLKHHVQEREIAYDTFMSILKKDQQFIDKIVDVPTVISCQRKMACSFSIVDHQYIRCLPPYKLKDKFHWCEIAAKEFNLPDKLFFMVTHLASFSEFSAFEISSYVTIKSIDSVYDNGKYMTYRILWVSSLDPYEFCTYFSFKKDKESRKLVGISTL